MPGVYFQCQRCANCCRWPGFVKVDADEINALARHEGLAEREFIERFTRLRPKRDGLALTDKPNGEGVFLEGGGCAVQAVKPRQCRAFPNGWNFPGWRDVCEAVPVATDAGSDSASAVERNLQPLLPRESSSASPARG